MNRIERRLFWRTIGLGLSLTLAVVCADGVGLLDQLERFLYDFRARNFQAFTPKPTDQIVHLDIDDPSMEQIGAFPWARTKIAEMIDEIHLAGAKVLGMDIIFTDPQETRYEKLRDGTFREIQDDQNLARSVKQAGNVLIPVSVRMLERGQTAPPTSRPARLDEFSLPLPDRLPVLRAESELKMIPQLLDSIRYSAVVDFLPDSDGVVRNVPLFVNYRGRLMPHMSLATTCAQLGVPLESLKIDSNSITIPIKDGPPIVIPVRTIRSKQFGPVGMFMSIPWFGGTGRGSWLRIYDYPAFADSRQHVSLNAVWQICQNLRQIRVNLEQKQKILDEADDALKSLAQINPSTKLTEFLASPTDAVRWELIDSNLEFLADEAKSLEAMEADLALDEAKLLGGYRAIQRAALSRTLDKLVEVQRADLKRQLNGKFALMGWTATGKTDAYPTSMDPLVPGPVMQGVVFNAIMTRHFWRVAPWWIGALSTLAFGLVTTLIVARFSIWPALFCTFALVGGYLIFNGLLLFDYGGIVLGSGAPLVSAMGIWFGVTVSRFLYEQAERSRITERFSDYVDPMVVRAVVQNPEAVRFDGQVKEITVVFTDLAGFTTISERLQEKTVPMLNEYMSLMLPIIRENNGYWNKFLGDGIMFFFNAPADNSNHAVDAVVTALQMQKSLSMFNQKLLEQNLPAVEMRAGISTGMMVVGDAGSTDPKHKASDYTVLGDEVNLGARLESANKATGTRLLVNERTAELCRDTVLLRPVGSLQVAGKTEGVMTFEALCLASEATDNQKALVAMSSDVVQRFRTGAFETCIAAARELEAAFGQSKFTTLYLTLAEEYLKNPPGDEFDGTIILSSK